ncbi:MAG: bifunctional DNA primase/polymerase [Acidobacteria bacterium]|nr:bifunctional DNA primase/polymerase [Acidobacteriota bacterium]
MSAQVQDAKQQAERYAQHRRRNHANIEAMENHVIADIVRLAAEAFMAANPGDDRTLAEIMAEFEMPPRVRHLISALQGSHGGGLVPFEEFSRDYLTIGRQLQYAGTDDAIRSRVRRSIDELQEWQYKVSVQLFVIVKGGQVIGRQPNGDPIRKSTSFIDYLKPHSDEGAMRARASSEWAKHPGRALEAQVDSVIKNLPALGTREESGADKKEPALQPVDVYEERQEKRICEAAEKVADQIELRGGDSDLFLEKLEISFKRIRDSRKKTEPARRDFTSLSHVEDTEDEPPDEPGPKGSLRNKNGTQSTPQVARNQQHNFAEMGETTPAGALSALWGNASGDVPVTVTGHLGEGPEGGCYMSIAESSTGVPFDELSFPEPNMLEWALMWVSRGVPVFPLHEVYDGGLCTCTCVDHQKKGRPLCEGDNQVCGSECVSPGKHPRTDFKLGIFGGVTCATLDEAKTRLWWEKHPTANIGGRTGSASGIFGVDQDPKNGGNASLHDLCEVYGLEWLNTWRNMSGSGGDHFLYALPQGLKLPNSTSKLALGIDTRGENGYLVMPPSLHVSGERYHVLEPRDFLPVPQFIIDRLTKAESAQKVVIDFQERRDRLAVNGNKERFLDGYRNDGLFGVGYGRWLHGWANNGAELQDQLLEVNTVRCVPPLDESEVIALAVHIAEDYAHLRGAQAAQNEGVA